MLHNLHIFHGKNKDKESQKEVGLKSGKNKINKNVIAIVYFRKLSANIEKIITSSQVAASFFFFQNKLSHKQFVFTLLHHLGVYFPT